MLSKTKLFSMRPFKTSKPRVCFDFCCRHTWYCSSAILLWKQANHLSNILHYYDEGEGEIEVVYWASVTRISVLVSLIETPSRWAFDTQANWIRPQRYSPVVWPCVALWSAMLSGMSQQGFLFATSAMELLISSSVDVPAFTSKGSWLSISFCLAPQR